MINAYALGINVPSDERFLRISRALGANYSSVEEMVKDPNLDWD